MATLKNLGRDTEAGLRDKIENDSVYEFKDFETDEKPEKITVKNDLTQYNSRIKKTGETDFEWDSLVLEIDKMEAVDINKYVSVVCDSFANPDFVWHKDPGQGRPIQTFKVDGKRQVLYDLHEDEHGYHLHLKVYRYTLNKETRNVASAPNDVAKVADAQLKFLNENLTKNGYLEIGKSVKSFGNQHEKPTEETKVDAVEIVQDKRTVDEVLEDISKNAEYSESSISTALDADQKELANLLQKVKQVTAEIETKKEAKRLIGENKQLALTVKTQNEELTKANERIGNLEFGITTLKEIHSEELEEKDQKYRTIISEKDNQLTEFEQKVGELSIELENVLYDKDQAYETIHIKNGIIEEKEKELLEQTQFAESYKELANLQKEQIEEARQALAEQKQAFIEQKEILKEQTDFIKLQNEEIQKLQDANKKQLEEFQAQKEIQNLEIQKLQDANKAQAEEIKKVQEENKNLIEINTKLSSVVKHLGDVTAKMKNSYNEFVKNVKAKLSASPAFKKHLTEIMGNVDKNQETIYKEVNKVANEFSGLNIEVNKDLIHSAKKATAEQELNNPDKNKEIKPK